MDNGISLKQALQVGAVLLALKICLGLLRSSIQYVHKLLDLRMRRLLLFCSSFLPSEMYFKIAYAK